MMLVPLRMVGRQVGGVVLVLLCRLPLKKRARQVATCVGFLLHGGKVISPLCKSIPQPPRGAHVMTSAIVNHTVCRLFLRLSKNPVHRFLQFYEGAIPVVLEYARTMLVDLPRLRRRSERKIRDAELEEDEMRRKLDLQVRREVTKLWDERHESGASQVCDLLTDLGGFYLKVGQVFGTKQDLLPSQYTKRLKILFDSCKPSPSAYIRETLSSEFGGRAGELFSSFEGEPMASATIAQVHEATISSDKYEALLSSEDKQAFGGARKRQVEGGEGSDQAIKMAVKIQHKGVDQLMENDIGNLIKFSEGMERLNLKLNFDHLSVMREYRELVPQEFDFAREVRNLRRIAKCFKQSRISEHVVTPVALSQLCTDKVITMTFLQGPTFSQIMKQHEKVHQESNQSSSKAAAKIDTKGFDPKQLLTRLLEAYGQQIFLEHLFHTDPHPGNLVWVRPASNGEEPRLGLIDFGECKELQKETVILLAQITIALARGTRQMIADCLDQTGVVVEGVANDFKATVAKIIFDSRMDIPEAHLSPFDENAPEEMKLVNVSKVPEEVFMIIRVVTLVRGMLAAFACDVSAAAVWEPFARKALEKYNVPSPVPEGSTIGADTDNPFHTQGKQCLLKRRVSNVFRDMKLVSQWMQLHGLPYDRQSLTPMAVNRVTSIKSLAQAALKEDPILESALARFCEEDKVKAKQLAMEQERDSIWREQALKKEKELELKHQQLVATTPNKKEKKKKLKHLKLEMIRWLGF